MGAQEPCTLVSPGDSDQLWILSTNSGLVDQSERVSSVVKRVSRLLLWWMKSGVQRCCPVLVLQTSWSGTLASDTRHLLRVVPEVGNRSLRKAFVTLLFDGALFCSEDENQRGKKVQKDQEEGKDWAEAAGSTLSREEENQKVDEKQS